MKLKEKFQRFWTLSKSHEGFTLVELIVVIAILAILAGVAIPVYNGYIKKANTAADQQLLDTVNTAYAAACLEEGINHFELDSKTAKMYITDGIVDVEKIKPADLKEAFAFYFAGNEAATFNTFTYLTYDQTKGLFVDGGDGTVTVQYGNATITVSQEYLDTLNDSGFIKYDGLGTATLVGKLDSVTTLATNLFGNSQADGAGHQLLQNVLVDDDFQAYAAQAVGIKTEGKTKEQIQDELYDKMEDIVGENGDQNAFLANAAVLYASKEAASMKTEDVITMLSSGDAKGAIIGNMQNNNTSDALAQAALAYGMYTAFAHSEYGSDDAKNKDEFAAMNDLNNPEFIKYMQSDAAKTDLEGYMAALNVINSSTGNEDAVSKLLTGGFGDPDLIAAINGALGTK